MLYNSECLYLQGNGFLITVVVITRYLDIVKVLWTVRRLSISVTFLSVIYAHKIPGMRASTCYNDETGSFHKHKPERAQSRRER